MSKTPQATITVGDETITRDVCSLELRTRAEGGNILRLTGGVEIRVDDEMARAVAVEYHEETSTHEPTGGDDE